MLAHEFVEAFSSVPPRIRISQVIAVLAVLIDFGWRFAMRNFIHPSFIDIPAGSWLASTSENGPKKSGPMKTKKSKWIRLS